MWEISISKKVKLIKLIKTQVKRDKKPNATKDFTIDLFNPIIA